MFSRKFIIIALLILGTVYSWYNLLPQPAEIMMVSNEKQLKLHNILLEPVANDDDFIFIPTFTTEIVDLFQPVDEEYDAELTMEDD